MHCGHATVHRRPPLATLYLWTQWPSGIVEELVPGSFSAVPDSDQILEAAEQQTQFDIISLPNVNRTMFNSLFGGQYRVQVKKELAKGCGHKVPCLSAELVPNWGRKNVKDKDQRHIKSTKKAGERILWSLDRLQNLYCTTHSLYLIVPINLKKLTAIQSTARVTLGTCTNMGPSKEQPSREARSRKRAIGPSGSFNRFMWVPYLGKYFKIFKQPVWNLIRLIQDSNPADLLMYVNFKFQLRESTILFCYQNVSADYPLAKPGTVVLLEGLVKCLYI